MLETNGWCMPGYMTKGALQRELNRYIQLQPSQAVLYSGLLGSVRTSLVLLGLARAFYLQQRLS